MYASLLSTLAFSTKDIQSIRSIQHVIPPPPDLYQSRQVYWGNPYSDVDSDNDSDDMSAAASNPTVALAGLTTEATEAVTVVADAVDASDVIADEYTPIADATITDAHIGLEHAVIAAVGLRWKCRRHVATCRHDMTCRSNYGQMGPCHQHDIEDVVAVCVGLSRHLPDFPK
jgi:hypothetical protein